jgi:Putative zinc-finger
MPMAHIEEDLLDRYAMGALSGDTVQRVEEHLLSCKLCQARLVETDEFLAVFSEAATQPDARPTRRWTELILSRTALWAGAALAGLTVFLAVQMRHEATQPTATVLMQSFRGAELEARMASGKPVVLAFDLTVQAPAADYQIEVVDTAGNEVLKTRPELKDGRLTGLITKLASGSYWVRVYRIRPATELVAEYGLEAQ